MSEALAASIQTASLSVVGVVRDHNEDYCAEFRDQTGARLLVVADGMGGHRGGSTASRVAVEAIGEIFKGGKVALDELIEVAVAGANARVYSMARADPSLQGMGTTIVLLLISREGKAWVGHVGDSRVYLARSQKLSPLTQDHSIVEEMVRQGVITSEEAKVHPRRNEIMRSVGVQPDVKPDILPLEIAPGDRFLLCSDGLTRHVSDEKLLEAMLEGSPALAVRSLIDSANESGGTDNITVQMAQVPGESGPARVTQTVSATAIERKMGKGAHARQSQMRMVAAVGAGVVGLLGLLVIWLLASGGETSTKGLPHHEPDTQSESAPPISE